MGYKTYRDLPFEDLHLISIAFGSIDIGSMVIAYIEGRSMISSPLPSRPLEVCLL